MKKGLFLLAALMFVQISNSFSQSNWKLYKSTYGNYQMLDTLFNIKKIITSKKQAYIATGYGLGTIKNDKVEWFNWNNTGLTNKNTWSIFGMCIDKNDNIWCATFYGLFKYDGSQFTLFTSSNSGLLTNSFTGITCDQDNNIWCTDNGKYIYKIKDSSIQVFDLINLKLPLPYIQGSFIQTDNQDNIWYSSGKLLVHYDGDKWVVSDSNFVPLDGDYISKLFITNDGSIAIAVRKEVILIYRNGIWNKYSNDNIAGLPAYEQGKSYVFSISEDNNRNILVGVGGVYQKEKAKILVLDKNIEVNKLWSSIDLPPIGTADSTDANSYGPAAIAIDDENKLWVGTNLEGVLLYNNYPSSIEEYDENGYNLNISPNPASDYLTINTNQEIGKIEIFSALGLKVLETEWQEKIDVRNLPEGIYFLIIKSGNFTDTMKFVIMR